jgi:hypothetical protein
MRLNDTRIVIFSLEDSWRYYGQVLLEGEEAEVPEGLVVAIWQEGKETNCKEGGLVDGLILGETVVIHTGPFVGNKAVGYLCLPARRVGVLWKNCLRTGSSRIFLLN